MLETDKLIGESEMINAQRADKESLTTVLRELAKGRYVIPDFQRAFEWDPSDINALIQSVFRDYYIGNLLLWKGTPANFDALSCQPVYGYESKGKPDYIVLDGQQRLTALHYACMAPDIHAPHRKSRYVYFVRLDLFEFYEEDDQMVHQAPDEAFVYDWTGRGLRILKDSREQFRRHYFPVALLGEASSLKLARWFEKYRAYWEEHPEAPMIQQHQERADHFQELVDQLLTQYQISYIELDRDLAIAKVCDIFTQINSRGVPLSIFVNDRRKPGKHEPADLS